jgi:hypothetical protein
VCRCVGMCWDGLGWIELTLLTFYVRFGRCDIAWNAVRTCPKGTWWARVGGIDDVASNLQPMTSARRLIILPSGNTVLHTSTSSPSQHTEQFPAGTVKRGIPCPLLHPSIPITLIPHSNRPTFPHLPSTSVGYTQVLYSSTSLPTQ